jgi:hypothetical protein
MKKLLLLASILVIASPFNAKALDIDLDAYMSKKTQKMVLPCAASVVVGAVMNEIGAGVAVCGGIVTYQLIDSSQTITQDKVRDDLLVHDKMVEASIKKLKDDHTRDYAAHREAIREIVVEKFASEGKETADLVRAYINSTEFEALLRQKTIELLNNSEEVLSKRLQQIAEQIEVKVLRRVEQSLTVGE